jgi:short-subunit dehydrogenase
MANIVRAVNHRLLQRSVLPSLPGLLGGREHGGASLAGKTVAITGASAGIGRAAAYRLAGRGATLVLIARNGDELAETVKGVQQRGGTAIAIEADLTDEDSAGAVIAELNRRKIDVLVNNAGRSIRRKIIDSTDRMHDFERTMAINYFAAVRLTLGVLDGMRERGSGQIVNVCTWALRPGTMPLFGAYGASKAALEMFSRSLGAELEGSGVAVTVVYFPLVKTEMIAPTAKYDSRVTLTDTEAGEWIEHAIDARPLRIVPNLMKAAPLADITVPGVMDKFSRIIS